MEKVAIFHYLPDCFLNSEICYAPQDSTLAIFGRPFRHRKHVVDLERSNRSISQSASNLSAVMRALRRDDLLPLANSLLRNWLRSVMIIRELHSSTPLASSTFVESSKQASRFCSLLSPPLSPSGILITYLLLQPKPSLRPTDRTRTPFANVAIRVGVGLSWAKEEVAPDSHIISFLSTVRRH